MYGQQVVDRINFRRGRILPAFQVNASAGADIYKSERLNVRIQADGQNLNNILNVIDFGGLFSGNAIGPSRSYALRLDRAILISDCSKSAPERFTLEEFAPRGRSHRGR